MSTFEPTDIYHVVKTKLFSKNIPEIFLEIIIFKDFLDFYSVKTNMKKICNELKRLRNFSWCSLCKKNIFFHSLYIIRKDNFYENDSICKFCVAAIVVKTDPISYLIDNDMLDIDILSNLHDDYRYFIVKNKLTNLTLIDWFKQKLNRYSTTLTKINTFNGYEHRLEFKFTLEFRILNDFQNYGICYDF